MTTARDITLTVNGVARTAAAQPRTLLSDYLRHTMGLTGTHVGCEQGVCGSCTILLDGVPVRSCLLLAVQADGCSVETVEGLAQDGRLSGIQQAMLDRYGLQCGFCTPGLLMSLTYAERAGLAAEEASTSILAGHLCRCTGYGGIRDAIAQHWQAKQAKEVAR